MPSCFLSYARGDDEPFVERLGTRLRESGIEVWWDREAMRSSGVHFLQEIQDGIRARAWFVLVSGPAAARSDYVAHEIEMAGVTCVPTVLVLRLGDRQDVPGRFRHHHQFDLRVDETGRDFEGLVETLKGDAPTPGGVLGLLPARPAHLLRRDTDLESVVRDVLADVTDPLAISSASATASLTGMAGAGKTVLATMAAQDCRIRHHFPGGVVFVRLGPEATAQSAAHDIRRALSGDRGIGAATWTSEDDAFEYLRESAGPDKRLFVLDDVWEVEHLAPVVRAIAGTPSRILLTTRRTDLGRDVGVVHHRLELLDAQTAHRFLLEWSGSGASTPLPDGVAEVARACGYLPLGLAVAGFLIGDGVTWTDLATLLGNADLRALDVVLGAYEHAGVYAAIDVSARRLAFERPDLWSRYLDLALFDTPAPRHIVAQLWGVSSMAAVRRDLQDLIRRSLLIDARNDSITLHDLHRSYLLARGADPRALAARLINTLGEPQDWIDQARSEPWLRRNLFSLLCTAEDDTQLLALQRLPGDYGAAPAWFELSREQGELDQYWADLERADLHQRSRMSASELLGAVVERAVVRATLRSFSRRPPELTLAAVRAGVLSPLSAWRQAGQMPRGRARLTALARLAPVLQTREERIAAGQAALDELVTLDGRQRDDIIVQLLAGLPEPELVDRALSLAESADDSTYVVLLALAPRLDDAQRQRARAIADRFDEPQRRVALAGLTLGLDEAAIHEAQSSLQLEPDEAIEVLIRASAPDTSRLVAWLAPLVDGFTGSLFHFPELWRVLPADQIAKFLAGQKDLGAVTEAPNTVTRSLCEIVVAQPQLAPVVLAIARRLDPQNLAIAVLGAAARVADVSARPALQAEVVERVHNEIATGAVEWMADVLKESSGLVPVEVASLLVDVAERIDSPQPRCQTIAALVTSMPAEHTERIVRRELRRLDGTVDGHAVRDGLAALAPVIRADDIGAALLVADGPRDNGFDTAGLGALAVELDELRRPELHTWALSTYLPGGPNAAQPVWAMSSLVEEVLDLDASPATVSVARELTASIDDRDAYYRVGPLAVLARVAPAASMWSEVETTFGRIHDDWALARAIARAARLGPPDRQANLVGRCLQLVDSMKPQDQDSQTLVDLLRTGDERAVRLAERLLHSYYPERFQELYPELPIAILEAEISPLFGGPDRLLIEYAFKLAQSGREAEALASIRRTKSLTDDGLRRVAPLLSKPAVEGLLSGSPAPHQWTVAVLCVRLAELGDLPTAVQIVRRDVDNPGWRLPALASCAAVEAPTGRGGLLDEVLKELAAVPENEIVDQWWRALGTVGAAIAALPAELRPAQLGRAIEIASSRSRLQAIPALWTLAPAYAAVAGPDGVWEAFDAVRRVLGWWPSQNHLVANRSG